MVNEEKVKQLYKVALYEKREEKLHKQTGKYYRSDYIGKEILKSIFTGSLAYLFILILFVINKWESFLEVVNQVDITGWIIPIVGVYVGYMLVYLVLTYVIYKNRYENSRKHLDEYEEELRILHNMYEREEKLK
ncbi:MAG: hypothetical protein IJF60_07035 [Agathobacter sp.]|nr:hypothetical protein [Agathobacter sp.]